MRIPVYDVTPHDNGFQGVSEIRSQTIANIQVSVSVRSFRGQLGYLISKLFCAIWSEKRTRYFLQTRFVCGVATLGFFYCHSYCRRYTRYDDKSMEHTLFNFVERANRGKCVCNHCCYAVYMQGGYDSDTDYMVLIKLYVQVNIMQLSVDIILLVLWLTIRLNMQSTGIVSTCLCQLNYSTYQTTATTKSFCSGFRVSDIYKVEKFESNRIIFMRWRNAENCMKLKHKNRVILYDEPSKLLRLDTFHILHVWRDSTKKPLSI